MDMNDEAERGRKAWIDRKSGEVHGSGSGAGGGGNPDEDHDKDPMAGAGAEPSGGPKPIDESVQPTTDKERANDS